MKLNKFYFIQVFVGLQKYDRKSYLNSFISNIDILGPEFHILFGNVDLISDFGKGAHEVILQVLSDFMLVYL